jgi:tRNA A-37 threonylcarbamoyl transferase component Bud32
MPDAQPHDDATNRIRRLKEPPVRESSQVTSQNSGPPEPESIDESELSKTNREPFARVQVLTKRALPDLTILEEIGRGGMGVVYRVRDLLGKEFALKTLLTRSFRTEDLARFLEEAQAMAALQHPNIVPIHSYRIYDGTPMFLMPLFEGSLREYWGAYKQNPQRGIAILAKIADAVGLMHSKGFVHRDLKPGNVLMDRSERPYVSDFGLIRNLDSSLSGRPETENPAAVDPKSDTAPAAALRTVTEQGRILGTRKYMSPEQAAGESNKVSPQWDVWAIGVMLHELLTGKFPDVKDDAAVMPSESDPKTPRELDRIVGRCLARNPDDRYPDARPLASDLNRWLSRKKRFALRVGTALAAGVLLVATVWGASAMFGDGQTPLERIQAELNAGKQVTLIGETGHPVYSRRLVDPGLIVNGDPSVPFRVAATEFGLVELLPRDPDRTYLELEGEFRSDPSASPTARGGFYVSHNPEIDPNGPAHLLMSATFIEACLPPKIKNPPGRQCFRQDFLFHVQHDLDRPAGRNKSYLICNAFEEIANTPPGGPCPWRHVRIRMSPTGSTARIDQFPEMRLPQEGKEDVVGWNSVLPEPLRRPTYGPEGGLGLIVLSANYSVKNVRVRTFPP